MASGRLHRDLSLVLYGEGGDICILIADVPWNRKQQPTPIFLPGKFQGQRGPWGCKELDMTECARTHTHTHTHTLTHTLTHTHSHTHT